MKLITAAFLVFGFFTTAWPQNSVEEDSSSQSSVDSPLAQSLSNDLFNGAVVKAGQKLYKQAIQDFTQDMQRLSPGGWFWIQELNWRATCYHEDGQYDAEIADLTEILWFRYRDDYDSDRVGRWALFNRGVAYRMKGDYDDAIVDLTNFIAKMPDIAPAYNERAAAYESKDQNALALADLNKAILLQPADLVLRVNRATLELAQFDHQAALRDASKALHLADKETDKAWAYACRAAAFAQAGDFERAIRDVNAAVALDPKFATAYSLRAAVKELMGQSSEAKSDKEKAKQLDSDSYQLVVR